MCYNVLGVYHISYSKKQPNYQGGNRLNHSVKLGWEGNVMNPILY